MTVQGVVGDIGLCAYKPLEKRRIRAVKHRVPFFEPVEFVGSLFPEPIKIGSSLLEGGFIIVGVEVGVDHQLGQGPKHAPLFQQGLSGLFF